MGLSEAECEYLVERKDGKMVNLTGQARSDAENAWLKENQAAYLGKWVALDWDKLLASGATAKEVFAAVEGYEPTPLVVKVRKSDMPFGGW